MAITQRHPASTTPVPDGAVPPGAHSPGPRRAGPRQPAGRSTLRTMTRARPDGGASTARPDGRETLAPLFDTVDGLRGPGADGFAGLADPLVVPDLRGWATARDLIEGGAFGHLTAMAHRHWPASPPTEVALGWKAYSYSAALPAVLSWAVGRRVPLLEPRDVLVRFPSGSTPVRIGLRHARVAVLPDDTLATAGASGVIVLADEAALLAVLRRQMLDWHLRPLAERIRRERRVGRRTLLGTLAAGIAHAVVHAAGSLSGPATGEATRLLHGLGLTGLVEMSDEPPTVRRRTCCFAYRGPRGRICPGCCLAPALDRSRSL